MKSFHRKRHLTQPAENKKHRNISDDVLESLHAITAWLVRDPHRIRHLEAFAPINQRVNKILQLAREKGVRCDIHSYDPGPHLRLQAHCTEFPYASIDELRLTDSGPNLTVLIDGLTDPRNLGAIIRTANAVSARGVVIPAHRCCPVTPTVEGASAGATAYTPIVRVVNLARTVRLLKEYDVWVFALDPKGEQQLFDVELPSRLALVTGGEAGMSRLAREEADMRVRIPMGGAVQALNASVAASIALYRWYETFRNALTPRAT